MEPTTALAAIGTFLAGLALFFHGLDGIKASLNNVASRSLRQQMSRIVGKPALAAMWGFGIGAITQSATASTFIVTGMLAGGALPLRRGLNVIAWSNMGTVLLPFVAAFDSSIVVMFAIGLGGLLGTVRAGRRLLPLFRGLFMAGLLVFGLELLKQATRPLTHQEWFTQAASLLNGSLLFGFVLGIGARTVIQSTSAIVVIVVAFTNSGVFTETQGAMVIHGSGLGVGMTTLLLSRNLRGLPRQLALFQACINGFGGLLIAAITACEAALHAPGMSELFQNFGVASADKRLALVFLVQQATCLAIAASFGAKWSGWLAKWSPVTAEESLATPSYVHQLAGADAPTAMELIGREQLRIVERLPELLDSVRSDGRKSRRETDALSKAATTLGHEILGALAEQLESAMEPADGQRLLQVDMRQRSLLQLVDELSRFVAAVAEQQGRTSAAASNMVASMVEGLHAILEQLAEADRSADGMDREMVLAMTNDRGAMLDNTRASIASAIDARGATTLLYALSLFERNLWLIRKVAGGS